MPLAALNLDWFYYVPGSALAAVCLVLLVWFLFWDRSRGRRRCPRCWYDMRGVPGLQCPECGRSAHLEKLLYRARLRRRPAACAILLLIAILAAAIFVPASKGLRLIPNWALVRLASADELRQDRWILPRNSLAAEVMRRAETPGAFAPSDWRTLLRRARVITPARTPWPSEQPLHVNIDLPTWMFGATLTTSAKLEDAVTVSGGNSPFSRTVFALPNGQPHTDHFQRAGTLAKGQAQVQLDVTLTLQHFSSVPAGPNKITILPLPPEVVEVPGVVIDVPAAPSVQALLKPDPSPTVAGILEESFRFYGFWHTIVGRSRTRCIAITFNRPLRWDPDLAVAFQVQVLHGDEVVASTTFYDWNYQDNLGLTEHGLLTGDLDRLQHFDESDPTWIVRVTGGPLNALRNPSSTRYWSGTFDIPLSTVHKNSRR